MPISLLEAMAARVPVVATRVGDVPAVLDDLGVLVEPDDDKAMAAALAQTIDELPRHRELAVRAAHRVARQTTAQRRWPTVTPRSINRCAPPDESDADVAGIAPLPGILRLCVGDLGDMCNAGKGSAMDMVQKEPEPTGSKPQTWDAIASSYDAKRLGDPVYLACCDAIVERISPIKPGAVVLDAGCGTGIVSMALVQRRVELHALDYSKESLRVLEQKLAPLGVRATLTQGDIRHLDYPDGYFDAVICANTLQHLKPGDDQITAARELVRVLKPGGKFAFSVHHYSRKKQRSGWIKEGKPGDPGVDYIFRFSLADLESLIPETHGHGIVACGFYQMSWPGPLVPKAQKIATNLFGSALAHARMGHMLLAYGTK